MSRETSPAQRLINTGAAFTFALTSGAAELNTSTRNVDSHSSNNPIIIDAPQPKSVEELLQACITEGTVETIRLGTNNDGSEKVVDLFRDENGDLASRCTDGIMEVATNENGETEFVVNPLPRFTINNGEYPVREEGTKIVQAEIEPTDSQSNLDKIIQSLTIQNEGSEPIPPRAILRSIQEEGIGRMVGMMQLVVDGQNPEIIEFIPAVDRIITNVRVFQIIDGGNGVHFICFDANDTNPIYNDCTETDLEVRTAIRTNTDMNVRSGPGTNNQIIGSLEAGSIAPVVDGPIPGSGSNNGWIKVETGTPEAYVANINMQTGVAIFATPPAAPEAPMPPTEVPGTEVASREPEFFESLGLARFSERPQLSNSDGTVQIFYSDGYFSSESPIENFYATPATSEQALSYIMNNAFEAVNTDPANSRIPNRPYIQFGSEVLLSSYIQTSRRNPADNAVVRGQLNRVRQHVVSYEEYEQIAGLFRNDNKETQEMLANVGLNKASLPEHVGLYASRGNSSFAMGIGYFTEDGTLVIINHPIRLRERTRDFNYANVFSDGPGALLTTLERSMNIPQGSEVGITRKSKSNYDHLYGIFGCYSENNWCITPPATIHPILN